MMEMADVHPRPPSLVRRIRHSVWVVPVGLLIVSSVFLLLLWRYEHFRDEVSGQYLPFLQQAAGIHREQAALQLDLVHLLTAVEARQLDEAAIYRHGKQLIDRSSGLRFRAFELETQAAALNQLAALRQFEQGQGEYHNHLVASVDMLTVNLDNARSYSKRAAQAALQVNDQAALLVSALHRALGQQTEALSGQLQSLLLPVLLLVILLTLLGCWLFWRLLNGVEHTFSALHHTLARLAAGETTVEIPRMDASKEAQEGTMALETFRQTLVELSAIRQSLSDQVVARTAELAETNHALADKVQALQQAQQHLRLYEKIFDSTSEAIMVTNLVPEVITVNDAFVKITGFSRELILGQNPRITQSGRHPHEFYQQLWAQLAQDGHWFGEIWDRRANGEIYPKLLFIDTVLDETGKPVNYVGHFTDISEQKATEQALKEMAFYDRLTGLPNRHLLLQRMEHALECCQRDHASYGALLFLDLDHFKHINDSLGHQAGDQLLSEVAERLRQQVRSIDTVGRLAGDEFVVLLERLAADSSHAGRHAQRVGEKIVKALAQPYMLNGQEFFCSCSVGIALYGKDTESVESLLACADTAMYEAKRDGRNTLRFFDPAMQNNLVQRVCLEHQLRQALRESQLTLSYQPQLDDKGKVCGLEALLRWYNGSHFVSPAEFIPVAEESHLICEIGHWVLQEAGRQMQCWATQPHFADITVAVNISGTHFIRNDFVGEIQSLIKRYRLNPHQLKLELTEGVVLQNRDASVEKMKALQALGVRLSMDDFGTGYSSLSYLCHLPFDQIKIDRSFVQNMWKSSADAFIVQSVISLGKLLGSEVVAEGVEQENQRLMLSRLGCTLFQGYLFAKPMPVPELEAWITAHAKTAELLASC